MTDTDAQQLKSIVKDAFSEVINAKKEVIYNEFYEALEDFHLLEAIKEGETCGKATHVEVFELLEA
ncbi:MAG: hypothetical protein HW421_2607 [Ignavibacteria bacterium]|nr:hypothetical protein [Ignavibacteria bacterium]